MAQQIKHLPSNQKDQSLDSPDPHKCWKACTLAGLLSQAQKVEMGDPVLASSEFD